MPKIITDIESNKISVNLTDISDVTQYQYAYYLNENSEVIKKIWYSDSATVEFELQNNAIYSVTAFLKDKETKNIELLTSAPMRYMRGRKPNNIPYLKIEEMEMTNICNLSCQNCCTPTTKYPQGFIDDQTVLLALSWTQKGQTLNYHRQGEPLLHKELEKYIHWGVGAGIKPIVSTNGLLLDRERLASLYHNGLRHLVITLHTLKSLESFIQACQYFEEQGIDILNFNDRHKISTDDKMYFAGKVLDFSDQVKQSKDVRNALASIPDKVKPFLQHTPAHTWAGNVPDTKQDFTDDVITRKQSYCYFIQKSVVNMRWDGTIVGCCFDSENDIEIGHIRDFSNVSIDLSKYKLCKHCDANWATMQN